MGWLHDRLKDKQFLTARELYDNTMFRHVMGATINGETAIAGPIAVAAVLLPHYHTVKGIAPVSLLSSEDCVELGNEIRAKAISVNIGWASPSEMYKLGKQAAIEPAVGVALGGVNRYNPMSVIIVDGCSSPLRFRDLEDEGSPVLQIRGSSRFVEVVMAAAIIAKVARETVMAHHYHKVYPEYGWNTNFGYTTQKHVEAIIKKGVTPVHRDLSHLKSLKDAALFPNVRQRF